MDFDYFDWAYGIVPLEYPGQTYPSSSPTPTPAPSRPPATYEQPWYVDTINRTIERAAQVATVQSAGYPPYPTFPSPSPQSQPQPYPLPSPPPPPSGAGIQLSTNTLMILGLIGFAFVFGGRRGR